MEVISTDISRNKEWSSEVNEGTKSSSELKSIPVGDLAPNGYNPNHMSDKEFAEYLAEVKHHGHLSKPIVVRRLNDGKFEIIDGEHGWRAAKKLGFDEVLCENLGDVDDLEARRQTYKRNRGGQDNPVLLGRMFREMLNK